MAVIDLADLAEIIQFNNVLGYHLEGEEIN
jgi:hypothetical protein